MSTLEPLESRRLLSNVPSLFLSSRGTLIANGTESTDRIRLTFERRPRASQNRVRVVVESDAPNPFNEIRRVEQTFKLTVVRRIAVYAFDGGDLISDETNLNRPSSYFGGKGSDQITSFSRNTLLFDGDDGDDTLIGPQDEIRDPGIDSPLLGANKLLLERPTPRIVMLGGNGDDDLYMGSESAQTFGDLGNDTAYFRVSGACVARYGGDMESFLQILARGLGEGSVERFEW
jgi:hypothetical protein